MGKQNFDNRKNHLIRIILDVEDEQLLDALEMTLKMRSQAVGDALLKPMTHEELMRDLKEAQEDVDEGRVRTGEEIFKDWYGEEL